MSSGRAFALPALAVFALVVVPACAQSVISTHAGVIHFFEGAVYLGDQLLESHLGRFPTIPQGGELRTAEGRAEVLLTPGVFLRIGELGAIRLVVNDLADTWVELEAGSVVVDSGETNLDTSVSLLYKDWRIHILQKGVYRIDSDPPRLWVRQGQAEVFFGANGQPVSVEQGMTLPFASVLVPERSSEPPEDALNVWSNGRSSAISADDAITAQLDEDPASRTPDANAFTYFPILGVPPAMGPSSVGPYSSYLRYQPGFNSIYLPGYTYRPFIVGLSGVGIRGRWFPPYLPSTPRPGVSPGTGLLIPHPQHPGPGPIHAAPMRIGVRGGAHR